MRLSPKQLSSEVFFKTFFKTLFNTATDFETRLYFCAIPRILQPLMPSRSITLPNGYPRTPPYASHTSCRNRKGQPQKFAILRAILIHVFLLPRLLITLAPTLGDRTFNMSTEPRNRVIHMRDVLALKTERREVGHPPNGCISRLFGPI
jgi:hypothetical protein